MLATESDAARPELVPPASTPVNGSSSSHRRARWLALAWTLGIALVLWLPMPDLGASDSLPSFPLPLDKIGHGLLFLVLVPLLHNLWASRGRWWPLGTAIAYGAVTEGIQVLLSYRTGDLWDLAADALGALLGWLWCRLKTR